MTSLRTGTRAIRSVHVAAVMPRILPVRPTARATSSLVARRFTRASDLLSVSSTAPKTSPGVPMPT